ncbi:MAG: thiamine pyrophosphate-binding protein [Candidatus Poribacteria bacterium]
MTGGDILIESLKAQEVKAIFGMPGNQNVHIYDALYRRGEGIKHFVVRHEQSATFMADGYAFPAALGAKAAYPDRQVISVSGDGGFMMGSFELATAIKLGERAKRQRGQKVSI